MASKDKKVAKKAVKKKNGYELPKKLIVGSILTDNYKKQWKIGISIGIGGFGEIYSAIDVNTVTKKNEDYNRVVKIEPHTNGPLFVEMHFYMRNAKQEDINKFIKDRKLKTLGMPVFVGSGSHEIEDMKHRFLVMPRYGKDIWKIFLEQNRLFPLHTVYRIGWQLTNVLEYIHQREYVHMDIKGSNILLGYGPNSMEQVYLLDYGLACHYSTKEYKADPKKAHNGTIEYTSRDAHNGVPTMRGDIEILAYNIIEWAGAKLPWTISQQTLQKPVEVQSMKENFMKDVEKSLKSAFGMLPVPSPLNAFMKYVAAMKYNDVPDYKNIRSVFESGLKELKQTNSGKLEFIANKQDIVQTVASAKSPIKRAHTLTKEKTEKPPKRPKVLVSATESTSGEEKSVRSRRLNDRKRYAEDESDDDNVNEETVKRASKNKELKLKTSPEIKEKKSKTKSPPGKKSKEDKKSKDDTTTGSIFLKSSSKSSKKTVELNFNLDISIDSDVVVKVNRKDKKKNHD